MRVRARVNQADMIDLRAGQPVDVGLDAYPDLHFTGTITQISPLGVPSSLSNKVRTFIVLVAVNGSHPKLMPDLTASLDVQIERLPNALVVPRDSIGSDGEQTFVNVERGGRFDRQNVTVGAVNTHEAVVTGGLAEGVVVARNIGGPTK